MSNLGDVTINGKKYRVQLESYKEKDLADFAPRASVPGGSSIMAELLLYQPLNMTDWRHGYGFMWHTDAMGYLKTMGDVDTRSPGIVTFSSKPVDISDTTDARKGGITTFNNTIYAWGENVGTGTGVRKYSGGSWSPVYTPAGDVVVLNCLATEDYLFASAYNLRIQKITAAGVVSNAGADGASKNFAEFCIHNGKIWAYQTGSNLLHYSTQDDLSDLYGDLDDLGAPDPGAVTVGAGGFPLVGMISYAGYLYVFRSDGVWTVGEDNIARRVLDFSSENAPSVNFKVRAVYNGYLYFNVMSKLYQWNGSRLSDVTPPRLGDKFPYSEIRYYGAAVTASNYLYVLADWFNDEASSTSVDTVVSLFCFDGVGWHKLNDLLSGATLAQVSTYPMTFYTYSTKQLVVGVADKTYLITTPFRDVASNPFPVSLSSDTSPYLLTSRIDAGFRRIQKSTPSILVEADNVDTDRYLKVGYYLDNSTTYQPFGTVTAAGVTELYPNAASTVSSDATEEFYNMKLRVDFINTGAVNTSTPILEGLTLRFLMRPDVFYGYNFNIVGAANYVYGDSIDNRSPKDIRDELQAARDSKSPVEFIDIYGVSHKCYISSISLVAVERHDESDDGTINMESTINLNLVEAA